MKKDINKEQILDFFNNVEIYTGSSNVVEYITFGRSGVQPVSVLEWLKSIGKYDDTEYVERQINVYDCQSAEEAREKLTESELKIYGFLDIENDFAPDKFSEEYGTGYELAAEYLTSGFCSDETLVKFIECMITAEGDSEWCKKLKQDKDVVKFLELLYK